MAQPLGSLVLIVGASGVGKDTLIDGARQALDNDKRFAFLRRIVTRAASLGGEEHDILDLGTFLHMEEAGRFALSWEANNLRYALPLSLDTDLSLGRVVVASISRHALGQARAKYPNCAVILVTAEISRRAERLSRLGRETADQISARLARDSAAVPAGIEPLIIDNSGAIAMGVTAFVMALRAIAAQD